MGETVMPAAFQVQSKVFRALFFDIARTTSDTKLSQDLEYLLSRYAKEGDPFLYTTLPLLGRAVDKGLIQEEPLMVPPGWRLKKGTRLPIFLYQLFTKLWEDNGHLRWGYNNPPTADLSIVVSALRQITLIYSKVDEPSPEQLVEKTLTAFSERVSLRWAPDYSGCLKEIIPRARRLLSDLFSGDSAELCELRGFQRKPWGKHGPGAVAGRETGAEKWLFQKWPGLPADLFAVNSGTTVRSQATESQPVGRVVCVPKDFRGPRIICIEPKENQFAQQGIMAILYRLVQHHPLTRRSISFEDTSPSRDLCYDLTVGTIDLKDASDRITVDLGRLLLPKWVFHLITRYRTRRVTVNGEIVRTTCLNSMGNACCFPVETILFWCITRAAVDHVFYSLPYRMRVNMAKNIRVFGDDIICPLWAVDVVEEALGACGLLVNDAKTCQFSLVRESCGEWVYNKKGIRTVRFRSPRVTDHRSWIQWLDYSDQLHESSYHALAEACLDECRAFQKPSTLKRRWNRSLQRLEVRVPQIVMSGGKSKLDGEEGLYAYFTGNAMTPLLRGARKLVKLRWVDLSRWKHRDS